MKHYKFIFVILTYRSTADLPECITSISDKVSDYKIIIVNSHYDDSSSSWFQDYAEKHNCDFLDVPNKGYSYGNNRGIEFAKGNYHFDYLIISNPDIVIEKFDESIFDSIPKNIVVAPMITTIKGKAQNPYWLKKNEFAECLIYEGLKNRNRLPLYTGYAVNKAIRETGLKRFKSSDNQFMRIFAAHGSFCIYPRKVLEICNPLFDENMFLFSEERYLSHEFEKKKIKIVLVKGIEILHKEDGSMSVAKIDEDNEERKSTLYYYERLKGKTCDNSSISYKSKKKPKSLPTKPHTTSVVMATYNGSKYIKEQIESLLNQTRRPDEIIFCDDCSTDNTVDIIESMMQSNGLQYEIIKHEQNQGVAKSFQEGIKKTNGDVIFFCDQDDVWKKEKIEHFIDVFEDFDAELVFSDAEIVDSNLAPLNRTLWGSIHYDPVGFSKVKNSGLDIQQEYFVREMLKRNIFTGMCMAFKRDLIADYREFSQYMLHDEFIGWTAIKKGSVVPINERLVLYRQHESNAVGSKGIRKFESRAKAISFIKTSTEKDYRKLLDIHNMGFTGETHSLISEACRFYKWRTEIFRSNYLTSTIFWLEHVLKKDYKKFSSETERAALKDIFCIL